MRLDGLVVVTLMLLPLIILEGFAAYIFWVVVTGFYIVYIAYKTRKWVDPE